MIFAVVFTFLLLGTSVRGQVAVGVKGGVNFNTLKAAYSVPSGSLSAASPDATSSGIGYHLGFFVNTGTKASAAMRFELLFSDRSTADDYAYTIGSGTSARQFKGHVDNELRYVEVPVLLTVRASKELSIHGGAAAALLASASSLDKGTETWTESGNTYTKDYTDKGTDKDLSSVSVDLVLGGNYEMIPGLCFGLRYLFDLSDLDKTEYVTAKVSVFQVAVDYTFGGTKKE